MGYRFRGFFCDGGPEVGEAAVRRWPWCRWKSLTVPFAGVGVRGAPGAAVYADGAEADAERADALAFAADFPGVTFVWVEAECFGGGCEYAGWAARDGAVLLTEPPDGPGCDPLRRLLAPLGVLPPDGYFAPFVRGYWDER